MKALSLLPFAAALAGAVSLGSAGTDAQTSPPQQAVERENDSSARLAAAKELFELVSKDTVAQLVGQVAAQAWPTIETALRSKNPGIDAAALAALRKEFERIQLELMVDLMKDAPAIYARYFSTDEIRNIIGFYRSPIGTKAMQVMPRIMSEVMAKAMPRMQEMVARTNDAFMKVLRQRGYTI